METIYLNLPNSEVTLLLDSLRHYIKHIENLDESAVDEDTLADLLNDNENLKAIEAQLSAQFAEKFGKY
jgi:hypothetical protein